MRACYRDHAETIWLLSGDGDFIQLITEVLHTGKKAYVSAFSSGLNDELRFVVDEFLLLDKYFFITEEEKAANKKDPVVAPININIDPVQSESA